LERTQPELGPIVEYQGSNLLVKYDHMDFDGAINWVFLNFGEVLAYEVNSAICCSVETVKPSDVIEVRKDDGLNLAVVSF